MLHRAHAARKARSTSRGSPRLHRIAGDLPADLPGIVRQTRLARLPLAGIAVQAIFQGVLVTIVSLLLYGRAVAILGASGGAAFGALVPALSALSAIPLLDEWPNETDWLGIVLISAGVYLASGGPLPSQIPTVYPNEETPVRENRGFTSGRWGGGIPVRFDILDFVGRRSQVQLSKPNPRKQ